MVVEEAKEDGEMTKIKMINEELIEVMVGGILHLTFLHLLTMFKEEK